jgi:hypothetical protein
MMDLFASFGLGSLAALLVAGVGIGLVGGMLGIGGGIVAVPILLEVFGTRALSEVDRSALAIGTSQAVILLSSLSAAWAHGMGGRIDGAILRAWTGPMILGALIGLALAPFTPPYLSMTGFAAIALLLGAKMLLGERAALADEMPKGGKGWVPPLLIGLFSADLGVGAGTLDRPGAGPLPRAAEARDRSGRGLQPGRGLPLDDRLHGDGPGPAGPARGCDRLRQPRRDGAASRFRPCWLRRWRRVCPGGCRRDGWA